MNHPSEWQRIYHPKLGKRVYKHKGTGVITDSLWKIGRVLKKPLTNLVKKTGQKVAEKGINKASDVVVKKAGDKIESILRSRRPQRAVQSDPKRNTRKTDKPSQPAKPKLSRRDEMMLLNNLLSQL